MQPLILVESFTQRDFHLNVKIPAKVTNHKRHWRSIEPIKYHNWHVISVKRGITWDSESRLDGFTPRIGWENGASVPVQNKKRRDTKLKYMDTILDIQVKMPLSSPFFLTITRNDKWKWSRLWPIKDHLFGWWERGDFPNEPTPSHYLLK